MHIYQSQEASTTPKPSLFTKRTSICKMNLCQHCRNFETYQTTHFAINSTKFIRMSEWTNATSHELILNSLRSLSTLLKWPPTKKRTTSLCPGYQIFLKMTPILPNCRHEKFPKKFYTFWCDITYIKNIRGVMLVEGDCIIQMIYFEA